LLRPDDDEAVVAGGNGVDVTVTDDSVELDAIGSAADAAICELSPITISSASLASSLCSK